MNGETLRERGRSYLYENHLVKTAVLLESEMTATPG